MQGIGKHRLTSGKFTRHLHSRRALVSTVSHRVMGAGCFLQHIFKGRGD